MHKLPIIILLLLSFLPGFSGTIRGKVTDANTGEVLVGVTVQIQQLHQSVMTGLDGSYQLKNVPQGTYTLSATGVSYQPFSQSVDITDKDNGKDRVLIQNIGLQPAHATLQEATVVVGRTSGATDAGARQLEKVSDNVVNILSTHQLQLMPDVTVANVLRRVSGVTVDRGDNGEGRYPVIRGMDKRYNYTLVNGIKIPSPDDKNRYVPMDMFPSEMLQRLEVIKSLTPDMEGDAIGGVINMVMKDPPSHLTVNANAAGGYAQPLFDQSFTTYPHGAVNANAPNEIHSASYTPVYTDFTTRNLEFSQKRPLPDGQVGLTLGNRYLDNRLGVILSGSIQSTNRLTKDQFFDLSPQPDPTQGAPLMTDEQFRTYSTHEDRIGAHAKLDYRLGQHSRISFYTVYIRLNAYQSRMITDTGDNSPLGNNVISKDVTYSSRSRGDFQTVYNATLQGQHSIGTHFSIDWSAAYSDAGQKMPDRATLTLHQEFGDTAGQLRPHFALPQIVSMERLWQHNSDQDIAGYLNLHYTLRSGDHSFEIAAGGMARHKDRNNYYVDYEFTPLTAAGFTNLADAPFRLSTFSTQNPNIYEAKEDITAGYGSLRWKNARWNVLAGIRFENTHQTYDQTALSAGTTGKTGDQSYLDPLPSLQVKYQLNQQSALHLAYFSSISRPGFFEIIPYDFPGEYFDEIGNPALKHAKAQNVDLRYELFPGLSDQLLAGAFYKRIEDPIEYVYARPATSESAIEPSNVGTATNFGGELVYTHYWNKFGVSANYTYTHSNIPTVYKYYYTGPSGATSTLISKDRPLQGQAAHIGNLSLLYKDPKSGIDLQLATIYTGKHIVYLSQYGTPTASMDYWQRGTTVLDFSGEKTLGKHFSIYVKLNNLLNTADIIEMYFPPTQNIKTNFPDAAHRSDRTLVEKKKFGQTYLAGIRYHL
jgi:outer membrane receptor protein involved in Fe transport